MRLRLPGVPAGIGLRYFEPALDLRALISAYYVFRLDIPFLSDVMRADLGQLRFMLCGTGAYMRDGVMLPCDEVHLLGPSTAATRFDLHGPVLVFGIGLHPAGWAALVRDDASLLADCATDAKPRFGPLIDDMLTALRDAPDSITMVNIADVVMRALKAKAPSPPIHLTSIVDAWLTGAQNPSVDGLIAELGISARQIERLTKRIYGAPPKLLARKYRCLRAASLIGTRQLHWSEAAGDAYFDQSHFIRDFKRFTGLTPSQFQNAPPPVTILTLQRRAALGDIAPLARVS